MSRRGLPESESRSRSGTPSAGVPSALDRTPCPAVPKAGHQGRRSASTATGDTVSPSRKVKATSASAASISGWSFLRLGSSAGGSAMAIETNVPGGSAARSDCTNAAYPGAAAAENGKSRWTPATRPYGPPAAIRGFNDAATAPAMLFMAAPSPPPNAPASSGRARRTRTAGSRSRRCAGGDIGVEAPPPALERHLAGREEHGDRPDPLQRVFDPRLAGRGRVGEPHRVALGRPRGHRGRRAGRPAAARQEHRDDQKGNRRTGEREPAHQAAAPSAAVGRSNRTRRPRSSRFSAPIEPPCSSTIFLAIASPRPVPPLLAEK